MVTHEARRRAAICRAPLADDGDAAALHCWLDGHQPRLAPSVSAINHYIDDKRMPIRVATLGHDAEMLAFRLSWRIISAPASLHFSAAQWSLPPASIFPRLGGDG